ncbi:MAG: hypothetical protein PHT97_11515 [Methanoculleus sp.]|uniref:hypothetical protein n=2 Tax=Methanoculleus sp. TaxID=90427 RepID=UPI00260A381E|nr:hypothetical protein [Methanoculleus sp.]MDD4471772.1 hypothetical protein [Methanoculleus sp.]
MSEVYVMASYCDQGKIALLLALERYYRAQGKKVACLQRIKGQSDVGLYLKEGCYQYSLPLEAVKSRSALERWLPRGFDVYIIGISTAYSPIGAAYLDLFSNYNEIIPYDWLGKWTECVSNLIRSYAPDPDIITFWEEARNRNLQEKNVLEVVTGVPEPLDSPCLDEKRVLHLPEALVFDTFEPRMTLPQSNRNAIAVGAFPGEFWDVFPALRWYGYDYVRFIQRLEEENYDLAIIGECSNRSLRLPIKPKGASVICYQPSVYPPYNQPETEFQSGRNFRRVYENIRKKPVGAPLAGNGFSYRNNQNRFWLYQAYPGADIVRHEDDVVYCNGWVLPQYLMRDGLLEV